MVEVVPDGMENMEPLQRKDVETNEIFLHTQPSTGKMRRKEQDVKFILPW